VDLQGFLSACAEDRLADVQRGLAELDPGNGTEILAQGLAVARMRGATSVVGFLAPVVDALGGLAEAQREPERGKAVESASDEAFVSSSIPPAPAPADIPPPPAIPAPASARTQPSAPARADGSDGLRAHLKGLSSHDESKREESWQTLLAAGAPAVPLLIEGLSHRIGVARVLSAYVLMQFAQDGELFVTRPDVVAALASTDQDSDWETRHASAYALGHMGTPEALRALADWSASKDDVTRAWGLGGLAIAGDAAARESLRTVLSEGSPDGRFVAATVIGEVGDTIADYWALLEARSDPDKYARLAVEGALTSLADCLPPEVLAASGMQLSGLAGAGQGLDDPSSAEEIIGILVSEVSGRGAYDRAPRLVLALAGKGAEAVQAIGDAMRAPGITREAFRLLTWALGHVDAPEARQPLMDMAARWSDLEVKLQCTRALTRTLVFDSEVVGPLEAALRPVMRQGAVDEATGTSDLEVAVAVLKAGPTGLGETARRSLERLLLTDLGGAMRWEKRIQIEQSYGVLGDDLDPLYAEVLDALRAYKGPYCFRTAAERDADLVAQGLKRDPMPNSDASAARSAYDVGHPPAVGDRVELVLENEYLDPYYQIPAWSLASVQVEVVKVFVPSGSATSVYRGEVIQVGWWDGPYDLRAGEGVYFATEHVQAVL